MIHTHGTYLQCPATTLGHTLGAGSPVPSMPTPVLWTMPQLCPISTPASDATAHPCPALSCLVFCSNGECLYFKVSFILLLTAFLILLFLLLSLFHFIHCLFIYIQQHSSSCPFTVLSSPPSLSASCYINI